MGGEKSLNWRKKKRDGTNVVLREASRKKRDGEKITQEDQNSFPPL